MPKKRRPFTDECKKCKVTFDHVSRERRKVCDDCKTKQWMGTLEEAIEIAKGYASRSKMRKLDGSVYKTIDRNGWKNQCFAHMPHKYNAYSKGECLAEAAKYNTMRDFLAGSPGHYQRSNHSGWMDECSRHMTRLLKNWTEDDCRAVVSKCSGISQIQREYRTHYSKIQRSGWWHLLEHFPRLSGGYTRTDFLNICSRNNDDYGIFYIVEFEDIRERFYKFGVTSRSVNARFRENDGDYDVIVEIVAPAAFVFDLERYYKKATRKYRYTPKMLKDGATECFKCSRNNSLITSLL